jgi:hypothetical protein
MTQTNNYDNDEMVYGFFYKMADCSYIINLENIYWLNYLTDNEYTLTLCIYDCEKQCAYVVVEYCSFVAE